MEYRVVIAQGTEGLEDSVNAAVLAGWKPQGGMAMMVMDSKVATAQAMVRPRLKNEETPNEST